MRSLTLLAVSVSFLVSTQVIAQPVSAEAVNGLAAGTARAAKDRTTGVIFYEKVILPGAMARCDSYLHEATATSEGHWHDDPIVSATGACLGNMAMESRAQYFLDTDQSYTDVDGTTKWEYRERAWVRCVNESFGIEEDPQYVRLLCIKAQHP